MKSETGSGKTLAYLVPLIEYLSVKSLTEEKISRENGTYCIIFSPTRELCLQIEIELKKLTKLFNYIVCGAITGGENPKKEKARMRKGLNVIICTPGRFLYHLQNT
jgi:ATP-dependent RNA helicase DDX31/DBP7